MKETGIDWIGKIPEEWEVTKIKYLSDGKLQYGANAEGVEFSNELPRYIRITDINSKNTLKSEGKQSLPINLAKPYMLKDGDILFARSGATVGKTFIYKDEIGSSAFAGYLIKFRANLEKVIPKFVFYMTLGSGYENWKKSIFSQATIQNIGADKYGNMFLAIPKIEEQKTIINYLDSEIGRIDNTIKLLEKQIMKLVEYKKSIITETVTKGLLAKKENWKIERLKYHFSTNKGLSITKENLKDEGIPVISYGQIHSKYAVKVNPENADLPFIDEDYLKYKSALLEYGDFVFADTSEDIIGSGNFSTNFGSNNFFAGYHTIIVRLNNFYKHDFRYFMYLFDSEWFRKNIQSKVSGVKVYSITQQILKNATIIIPPLKEQKEIADYLDNKVPLLEKSIDLLHKSIKKQEEIKKSLIFEYITGKKRVI